MDQDDSNNDILYFPIQVKKSTHEENMAKPGHELAAEIRVLLTKKLNRVALGEYELTDRDRANIERMNAIYQNHNLPLIQID